MRNLKKFNNFELYRLHRDNQNILPNTSLILPDRNLYYTKKVYDHKIEYLSTNISQYYYQQYIDTGVLNSK